MKKVLVLSLALVALNACSSKDKEEMKETPMATEATTAVDTTKEQMVEKAKEEMAKVDGATQMAAMKASCELDKDVRVIEVKKTEVGGCDLFYTKFGEAKSVASSGFGTQYCEEVKDRIQTNLNKAGFSCQ